MANWQLLTDRWWRPGTRGWWCCALPSVCRWRSSGVRADRRWTGRIDRIHLDIREHARAGDEANASGRLERKAVTAVRHHVDRELAVRPIWELFGADVKRTIGDQAEQNVA